VPSFSSLGELKAEIQVRTMAQHMWAAASHILQYKDEQNVPQPVKRSIYRVSALLETIDLEFERVLRQREIYRAALNVEASVETLNVDLLEKILDRALPSQNKSDEDYGELLSDLVRFGVNTGSKLTQIVKKHYDEIMTHEREMLTRLTSDSDEENGDDIFFNHAGLTRSAMHFEFGDEWDKYLQDQDYLCSQEFPE
jgi:hypothetical protein